VRYSRRRQWFFNGKPVADDPGDLAPMRTGATACTLTLPRMSRRVAGEYYCVCENEEGSAVTPVTRVELVAKLRADRVAERKLALLQQHLMPTVVKIDGDGDSKREVVAVCIAAESASGTGGASFSVVLLGSETLSPVKFVPSIQSASGRPVIAWSDRMQTLAVVTDAMSSAASLGKKTDSKTVKVGGAVQVALYAFESAAAPSGQALRAPNAHGSSYRGAPSPSPSPPRAKANVPSASTTTTRQLTIQTITLESTFSGGVRAAAFLDGGKLLAVTDLHLSVAIFTVDPSQPLRLLHTICSAGGNRIASIASSADASVLALAFRNSPRVDAVRLARPSSASGGQTSDRLALAHTRRHQFALSVHLTAVDGAGTFAAVAESVGCLKTWISIVNLNTHAANADGDGDGDAGTPLRPRRRFGAHVGAITGLKWTESSSLLLSSGLDGFVRVWNVVPFASASRSDSASLLAEFHVGDSVLGMAYVSETSTFVTVSKAAQGAKHAAVRSHTLPLLKELEAFRREQQLGEAAVQMQKIWKGYQTRVLLAELLGESRGRKQSSVG
jgi:WD40 repeat protein